MENYDLRDVLRDEVAERGYNQAVIAKRANLTPAKFSNVLNKTRRLEVHEFIRICGAMHLMPDVVIQNAAQRQPAGGYAATSY